MLKKLSVAMSALCCAGCVHIDFPQNPSGPAYCNGVPNPPAGLIAWWPLSSMSASPFMNTVQTPDVISGLTAYLALNDGGSSPGSPSSLPTAGKVGGAVHFQYLGQLFEVSEADAPDPQGKLNFGTATGFTLDAWVKPGCGGAFDITTSGGQHRTANQTDPTHPVGCGHLPANILSKSTSTAGYTFYIDNSAHLALDLRGSGRSVHFVTQTTLDDIGDSSDWKHVAVRVPRVPDFAASNIIFFTVNGVPVAMNTSAGNGSQTTDTSNMNLSSGADVVMGGGDIVLDEAQVFGRPLEFWAIYDMFARGQCAPPPPVTPPDGQTLPDDQTHAHN